MCKLAVLSSAFAASFRLLGLDLRLGAVYVQSVSYVMQFEQRGFCPSHLILRT